MPKKNLNKNPIKKIVVCGCSYTAPGQSGIDKVWSHYLQDLIGIEVENLTWKSGGSNSDILRTMSEYIWTNDIKDTGFIVQWTTIDRLEFCNDEKEWYQVRHSRASPTRTDLPTDVVEKISRIRECQAYTYSESTHLWQFFQQIMTLDSMMQQNHSPYFQMYCLGDVMHNFLHKRKPFYFSQYDKSIYKMLKKTKWLYNNLIKADISSKGFSCISQDDPHFDKKGHAQVAKTLKSHIHKEQWL